MCHEYSFDWSQIRFFYMGRLSVSCQRPIKGERSFGELFKPEAAHNDAPENVVQSEEQGLVPEEMTREEALLVDAKENEESDESDETASNAPPTCTEPGSLIHRPAHHAGPDTSAQPLDGIAHCVRPAPAQVCEILLSASQGVSCSYAFWP